MDSLTVLDVNDCIDEILHGSSVDNRLGCQSSDFDDSLHHRNLGLKRVSTEAEWKAVRKFLSRHTDKNDELTQPDEERLALVPFFFAIGLYPLTGTPEPPCGVVTMYSAYSTWDGRCLFIDRFDIPNMDDVEMEKAILKVLAKIAVKLGCARLNWRRINIPTWYSEDSMPPEILYGWLTLRMERLAMLKYVGLTEEQLPALSLNHGLLSRSMVHSSFERCLEYTNESSESNTGSFRFRLSTNEDVEAIVRLVHGLAVYEKEPDAVNVTLENYRCDGHSNEPLFYCLLLDDVKTCESAKPYSCGMAFIYFGYEMGRGRFLYLEDLYLEEPYRKRGAGSLVMKFLARMALDLCCQNFYWVALDWNTPALNLYQKIGAKVQMGVVTVRYTQDKLKAVADTSG